MIRSGIGYDIHRFAEGLKLILGGVEIAHARGLEGHSDADVLSHAIADALLGAIGAGDIGQHFPNTDESIRGISSMSCLLRTGVGSEEETVYDSTPDAFEDSTTLRYLLRSGNPSFPKFSAISRRISRSTSVEIKIRNR